MSSFGKIALYAVNFSRKTSKKLYQEASCNQAPSEQAAMIHARENLEITAGKLQKACQFPKYSEKVHTLIREEIKADSIILLRKRKRKKVKGKYRKHSFYRAVVL